ncbi:MAG: sulfotransferase family 2 domain-containing protein [Phycisphaerales bacterium]|nr:sulfotransferase family 2 domain-containing protein [Phycisphaerales bacterium]
MSRNGILIHLHIPKNAGTTLSRMIKLRLITRPPTRLIHHDLVLGYYNVAGLDQRLQAIADLSPSKQRKVKFFEAHCAYGVHERLPEPSHYMTFLREPVDRTLSAFSHCKKQGHIPQDMPLEQFVSELPANPVWQTDNAQVRYLAGENGLIDTRPVGEVDRAMLDLAKERLDDMFFVGLMERFDESVILLGRKLGWSRLAYGRSNVNPDRARADEIDADTRELIERHNLLDTELYQHAEELFNRRLASEGPSLQREVERFTRRNRRAAVVLNPLYNSLKGARTMLDKITGKRA